MMPAMQSPLTTRVATEVRAEMGRAKVNQSELARLTNMNRGRLARRLNGHVPFDLAELQIIANALGRPDAHFLREAAEDTQNGGDHHD